MATNPALNVEDLATPPPEPVDDYVQWLKAAPTPFHAVQQCIRRLQALEFTERALGEPLQPVPGERLYLVHPDGKSLIAMVIGTRSPVETGFALVGAHTDSPDLRLRMNPLSSSAGTVQLTTQFHGGLIRRAWLDRPLALAGVAYQVVRDKHGTPAFNKLTGQPVVTRRLVHVDQPVAVIPDLAIHMDREKNDKGAINPATQLNAVIGTGMAEPDEVMRMLSAQAGVQLDQLDGFDLHLVSHIPPQRVGADRSMVLGARHDDLAMVYCGLQGLLTSVQRDPAPVRTRVAAFFDAEETGSVTSSGAASNFLRDVLTRVARRHPTTNKLADVEQAFAHTLCLSADMAHALHPNYMDLHDKQHAPKINQGVVIKANANDRYATTGETAALFVGICEAAGVRVQDYLVRQDLGCGTTIGPITAASLAARVVDIGCPMWAMHSTAETLGAHDLGAMIDAMRVFYVGGV
jgi:aspartyl aminopeptidase